MSHQLVSLTSDPSRRESLGQWAAACGLEVVFPQDDAHLSEVLLMDETVLVTVDTDHCPVDALGAVRMVTGTRWDTQLICHGVPVGGKTAVSHPELISSLRAIWPGG